MIFDNLYCRRPPLKEEETIIDNAMLYKDIMYHFIGHTPIMLANHTTYKTRSNMIYCLIDTNTANDFYTDNSTWYVYDPIKNKVYYDKNEIKFSFMKEYESYIQNVKLMVDKL